MIHNKNEMNKWKAEQLVYFKKYLNYFNKNSDEYRLLQSSISKLENYV